MYMLKKNRIIKRINIIKLLSKIKKNNCITLYISVNYMPSKNEISILYKHFIGCFILQLFPGKIKNMILTPSTLRKK